MSKIWFFGDSYAAPKHTEKSWTINVQEAFPEYDNENLAVIGSSLDYLYHTYEQNRKRFNTGDIVIMSLTTITRLFLRNRTSNGGPRFLLLSKILSPLSGSKEILEEDHEYYDYYASDLFNPETHTSKANLFLNSLQYDAMTKGIKIIALPITYNFPRIDYEDKNNITLVKTTDKYSLIGITNMQYNKKFNVKKWQEHSEAISYDNLQANHLSPENNLVLANKVIRHIKTNEPIDLTTDWII